MRIFKILLISIILSSCSSIKMVESWRNPTYNDFSPKRILVIGVTPDLETRKTFEFELKKELNKRDINALQSTIVFEKSFQDSNQTELEIEAQVDKLLDSGYDTILISTVKGIDENESFSGRSFKIDYRLRKFIGYYLVYQDVYFNQNYYKSYKVFHIETSIYNLEENSEKALIWTAAYDLVEPKDPTKVINKFVNTIIKTLEKEEIISNE